MSGATTVPLMLQTISQAEWQQARTLTDQSLAAAPHSADTWMLRGVLAARAKLYSHARDCLSRAVSIAPTAVEPRLALCELYLLFGQRAPAEVHIDEARALGSWPADPRARALEQLLAEQNGAPGPVSLPDVTFVIPFRADTDDRSRNLRVALRYLGRHVSESPIIVLEDEPGQPRFPAIAATLGPLGQRCRYLRAPVHPSGLFQKTRDLNLLLEAAETPVVAVYDTDVVLAPVQYALARAAIARGVGMVFPYNGLFIDLDRALSPVIDRELSIDNVDLLAPGNTIVAAQSVGGAVFFDRHALLAAGGYHEGFVSWGPEDLEIYFRFQRLGLGVERTAGPAVHMTHGRTPNSSDNHPFHLANRAEFDRLQALSPDELRAEVVAGRFRSPRPSS